MAGHTFRAAAAAGHTLAVGIGCTEWERSLVEHKYNRVVGAHSAVHRNNNKVGEGIKMRRTDALQSKEITTLMQKLVVVVEEFHMVAYHTGVHNTGMGTARKGR
jgi:hypothetical protein